MLGTVTGHGIVRVWNADEGWGVIDGPEVPGGCWTPFSAIAADGYRQLSPGQTVALRAEPVPQHGYAYRAVRVWTGGPEPAGREPDDRSPGAYQSMMTLTFGAGPPPGNRGWRYRGPVRQDTSRILTELADAPLTYPEVGATRDDSMPAGYGHLQRDFMLGSGQAVFDRAAAGLLGWHIHVAAGLTVITSTATATTGVVAVLQAGVGPLKLKIPGRVVYTVTEPGRQGFAYGTLPGHPEQGEEAFLVTLTDTGAVRATIRAFSRPATLLARAGGPMTRVFQQYATNRYVKALRGIAERDG
jgi:uncharacterized protein (UPF0548 family)/cold shock CspA family protein